MDAGDKARHRCRAAKTPRPIGNKEGVEAIMEVVNERLAAAHTRHSVSMYDVRYEEPKNSVAPNFAGYPPNRQFATVGEKNGAGEA